MNFDRLNLPTLVKLLQKSGKTAIAPFPNVTDTVFPS
jgi:hypothetical protein